jgi:hypothetical protein
VVQKIISKNPNATKRFQFLSFWNPLKAGLRRVIKFLSPQSSQPIKGLSMVGNWRYIIGAILLLGSGCLFLSISPYVGLTKAYLVSLPVFIAGVIIVWRGERKPPES